MPKRKLDELLVERGLAADIANARALVIAGSVYTGTLRLDKAGQLLNDESPLEVRSKKDHAWVSRGGLKLAGALEKFPISAKGRICIDVGASTGGFTDVLLQNGAAKVYAVDVGYGQLAWKLQSDPRVVVLDRTNARHLSREVIPDPVDMVVCDASFITLASVLPAALALVAEGALLVALIKPQFEVLKHEVGEGGIIRDAALHGRVCREVQAWLEGLGGWQVLGIEQSPITGQDGNVEFLIAATYRASHHG